MKYSSNLIKPFLAMLLCCLFLSFEAIASIKQWPLKRQGEVRYLGVVKVYDIGLYSPSNISSDNILDSNISKCLKLDYAVNLTQDQFKLATSKILKRQHSAEFLASIDAPLTALQASYKPVKKGDIYSLCYNGKTKRMKLDLNDKTLFEMQSAELAKAYLGIWLSKNNPISRPLLNNFFPDPKG